MFLIDEASGIPEIIFETAEGSMSTIGAKTLMFSNPTRTSGYFFNSFNKFRKHWSTHTVSCFDSTQVDPAFIKNMEKHGIESNIYRVRVLGEFPDSSDDAVIGLKILEDAVARDIAPFGEIVWGVDVARFGDDKTALVKRQGPRVLEKSRTWAQKDTMETSGMIKREYDDAPKELKPSKIVIDVIGLGAGVVDRLKELELPIVGLNVAECPSESEKYVRLRDELWFNAKDWFNDKACDIPDDEVLISELSGPKYSITSNGKLKVEAKAEMKKRGLDSPDVADAFLLTFCKEKPKMKKKDKKKSYQPSSWMG